MTTKNKLNSIKNNKPETHAYEHPSNSSEIHLLISQCSSNPSPVNAAAIIELKKNNNNKEKPINNLSVIIYRNSKESSAVHSKQETHQKSSTTRQYSSSITLSYCILLVNVKNMNKLLDLNVRNGRVKVYRVSTPCLHAIVVFM